MDQQSHMVILETPVILDMEDPSFVDPFFCGKIDGFPVLKELVFWNQQHFFVAPQAQRHKKSVRSRNSSTSWAGMTASVR